MAQFFSSLHFSVSHIKFDVHVSAYKAIKYLANIPLQSLYKDFTGGEAMHFDCILSWMILRFRDS